MANMTVPSIGAGSKSLPSEIKMRGMRHPVMWIKAQHPGVGGLGVAFPYRLRLSPGNYRVGMGWLRGLGQELDDGTDESGISDLNSIEAQSQVTGYDTSLQLNPTSLVTPLPTVTLPAPGGSLTAADLANLQAMAGASGDTTDFTNANMLAMAQNGTLTTNPPGYSGPLVASGSTPTSSLPTPPSGYAWASLISSTGQTLSKVLAVAQGGTAVTLPNGTQLVYGSPAAAAAGIGSSLSSLGTTLTSSPILLLGIAAVVLLFMSQSGGGRQ